MQILNKLRLAKLLKYIVNNAVTLLFAPNIFNAKSDVTGECCKLFCLKTIELKWIVGLKTILNTTIYYHYNNLKSYTWTWNIVFFLFCKILKKVNCSIFCVFTYTTLVLETYFERKFKYRQNFFNHFTCTAIAILGRNK